MKDSKEETRNRISNLKNMMHNVKEGKPVDTLDYDDELEEDEELIQFLNEKHEDEEYEMNDSYIYHPRKDSVYDVSLDEDSEIDKEYIIETDIDEEVVNFPHDDKSEGFNEKIGDNFDNIVSMEIHERPILAVASLGLGIILIIVSIIVLNSGTERIVDNVVSGENNYITVVLLIFGLLLIIYGIFKIFKIKSPFHSMMESMDKIEDEGEVQKIEAKAEPPSIPKSNIPLDKESYKVGEFNLDELKTSLRKSFSNRTKTNIEVKPTAEEEVNVEDLPLAREKSENEKGLIKEEIEEKNYEQAQLDGESIDEIFSQVKDLPKKK